MTGLATALSRELGRWRKPLAVHDPAEVLLDLAVTLALGGEHLSDIAVLRSEPALYGHVASDATVSRVINALAADAPTLPTCAVPVMTALKAIDSARAQARAQAWVLAGDHAQDHARTAKAPLVIDLDATPDHLPFGQAARDPDPEEGLRVHPLCAFLDQASTGPPGHRGAAQHGMRTASASRQGHRPCAPCRCTTTPANQIWVAVVELAADLLA